MAIHMRTVESDPLLPFDPARTERLLCKVHRSLYLPGETVERIDAALAVHLE
jgi:hypothetical protein